MLYQTFTRTWWKSNSDWPNGLEPSPGRRTNQEVHDSEKEAQAYCKQWNKTHNPGRLSLKCEYTAIQPKRSRKK